MGFNFTIDTKQLVCSSYSVTTRYRGSKANVINLSYVGNRDRFVEEFLGNEIPTCFN